MEKSSNFNKLMRNYKILQIVLLFGIGLLVWFIARGDEFAINLTIIKVISCVCVIGISIHGFRFNIRKIVLDECDYESYYMYLKGILKQKSNSTLNQINMCTTYLMLGMHDEAKDILAKLNDKLAQVKPITYLNIYILNMRYFAESSDVLGWKNFAEMQPNFQEYLERIAEKKKIRYLKQIEIWNEIINQNWEMVILLIKDIQVNDEIHRVIFSYWYALANKNLGKQKEADEHFSFVLSKANNTIYFSWAQKYIKGSLQPRQCVIEKKANSFEKMLFAVGMVIWGLTIIYGVSIVYFNDNTQAVLGKYNFTINQKELQQIYSESFDEYVLEIYVDPQKNNGKLYEMLTKPDTFYCCIFKKQGTYYRMLECYVNDVDDMEEKNIPYGRWSQEMIESVTLELLVSYVERYMGNFEKISKKEGYSFPCIGIHSDERVEKIQVQGESPIVESVEVQDKQWYIWQYRDIDYSNLVEDDIMCSE